MLEGFSGRRFTGLLPLLFFFLLFEVWGFKVHGAGCGAWEFMLFDLVCFGPVGRSMLKPKG